MNQRGLIPISLILWGLAALSVVTLVGGVVWKYNSAIERAVKAETALVECEKRYGETLEKVRIQNDAVLGLEKQAKAAQDRAKAASQAAAKAHIATQSERERLARLQAEFRAVWACPAGEALKSVREGLRP